MRKNPVWPRALVSKTWLLSAALLATLGAPGTARAKGGIADVDEEKPPLARTNRLCVGLTFGFGSAAMGRLHEGADQFTGALAKANKGTMDGEVKSDLQINAEVAIRYYAPYYILAHVGYGALYNWAKADLVLGGVRAQVENYNLLMEVPILVGGYYPLMGRVFLHGAVGPSIFFYPRSWWDVDYGGLPDFKADTGVGLQAMLGADFMVSENFSLGLELVYRYMKTGELKIQSDSPYVDGTVVTEHMFLGNGSSATYEMDFSGVSLALRIRFWVL